MFKRIVTVLLSALLLLSATSCHQPTDHTQEPPSETAHTPDAQASESLPESTNDSADETPESMPSSPEDSSETESIGMPWAEYQDKVGCFVTTESGHNLKDIMTDGESKIAVEHEDYGSNTFHITVFGDNSQYKTTISLSEGVRTPDIYCGFTDDQNGYVIIFHLQGYSVSPMDDIELACVLKTADGGQTWNLTEYHDLAVANGREYINAACFFSEDVGFFTARYYCTDHFAPRTYWTLDGGRTWAAMPKLDFSNLWQPFGNVGNDYSSEVADVCLVDGVYTITVRICTGYPWNLIKPDGEHVESIYVQFSSADLVNWELRR